MSIYSVVNLFIIAGNIFVFVLLTIVFFRMRRALKTLITLIEEQRKNENRKNG